MKLKFKEAEKKFKREQPRPEMNFKMERKPSVMIRELDLIDSIL